MQTQNPFTILLIAINVVLYFITTQDQKSLDALINWPYYVKRKHQWYRLFTSGFLHADLAHLFFNMFTLFFFGRFIEMAFNVGEMGGTFTFLGLYLSAIIISDLPTYFKKKEIYGYRSLGASGAVSAVVFATLMFNPWGSIYLYGALKISAAVYGILYLVYCIYMSKKGGDNINHDAHLWGAVYGLAFTTVVILICRPDLMDVLLEQLKHPSLFGR
jgi:membrane associated rhomboid family serine protease